MPSIPSETATKPPASPGSDTAHRAFRVEPRKQGFAVTIRDIDLREPLDETSSNAIREAWARHGVVVFPDQVLSHAELEAFTLGLGQFGHDPFIEPMADHPNILELRREAGEKAANFGAAWHSDWSFQPCPPSGTILHSKVVPPVGGRTFYADGHRAWEALSPTMQSMLEGRHAIHSAAFAYGPRGVLAKEPNERTMKIIVSEEAEETEVHPLVRTHPMTGRKSLFINPVYTVAIEGLHPEENFALLKFLYDHMVKEEFVYRHEWEENMLVLWDNRSTMHFAEGGYDGHLRLMHRTTLSGDRPF